MAFTLNPRDLPYQVRIERPVEDEAIDSAGSGTWEPVATVWAGVQDMLPSRGERLAEGMNITTRPARVRMRYRTDITTDMRLIKGDRIMQIVSAPVELGLRVGIEFMVEDYNPAGNPA